MRTVISSLVFAMGLFAAEQALADCAANATVGEVRQSHARGQQLEKNGDSPAALSAYVAALEYTCEANPVAADAARRAAAISRPLADAAKARGDHATAFDYYERGGHFAAADGELLARLEASPDDASLYSQALRHVQYRSLPAFQANEAPRIAATGAYRLDPRLAQAVAAMPSKAAARLLAAESAAFDEAWYARYMTLVQSMPQNPGDIAALQQYATRMQALHAGQQKDPLRDPLQALKRLRAWETQVTDPVLAAQLARQRAARASARAQTLTGKYADAPKLLELALDYVGQSALEDGAVETRRNQVRLQAEKLGDAATARQRHQLAIDYYGVAGADAKAGKARARLQVMAQQSMQPGIAALQRDAEALRAQFADPQKVAEMQRQAREAQRAMQSGSATRKAAAGNSADDLAAQLGL